MRGGLFRIVCVSGVVWCALSMLAQPSVAHAEKTIHWKGLEVDALLDQDGTLQISERHTIEFTGDWNGGERSVKVLPGQDFELLAVTRIDPVSGERRSLKRGDLGAVDHYGVFDAGGDYTIRWRARERSAPPFDHTVLVYVLDYELHGVLERRGGTAELAHNFAFVRPGVIDEMVVHLTLDPIWDVRGEFPGVWYQKNVHPALPFVVRATLAGEAPPFRFNKGLQLIALGAAALSFMLFVWLERRRGRLAPLEAAQVSDPEWFAEHLARFKPEVVSVLWNRSKPGPNAVAALLSRLELDGKIRTKLEGSDLHMELLVERDTFSGGERAFIDAFFFGDDDHTSQSAVRSHYSGGFDPVAPLRRDLIEARAKLLGPFRSSWLALLPSLALLVIAVFLFIHASGSGLVHVVPALALALVAAAIGGKLALSFRNRVDLGLRHTPRFLVFALLPVGFVVYNLQTSWLLRPEVALGAVLFALASYVLVLALARTNETGRGLTVRRQLTAARRQLELERGDTLTESVVPYVFAFGLAAKSRSWGVEKPRAESHDDRSSFSVSTSNGDRDRAPAPYQGGGGSFGGAGASGAWVGAIASMSSGVAAPSSSSSSSSSSSDSSSSSSSGSSSSGGGSAGGW